MWDCYFILAVRKQLYCATKAEKRYLLKNSLPIFPLQPILSRYFRFAILLSKRLRKITVHLYVSCTTVLQNNNAYTSMSLLPPKLSGQCLIIKIMLVLCCKGTVERNSKAACISAFLSVLCNSFTSVMKPLCLRE